MNKVLFLLLCVSALFAAENFSGIGIAVYKVSRGASIAAIAKGSPADLAGLRKGDCITTADGISLSKMSLSELKKTLRSDGARAIVLKVARNTDLFDVTLRRVQMQIIPLNAIDSSLSQEKLSVLAKQSVSNGYEFLDVVQTKNQNTGFYLKADGETLVKDVFPTIQNTNITLERFTRNQIIFDLEKLGSSRIKIFALDGSLLKVMKIDNVSIGANRLDWDGASLPSGQYTIQLEQEESISRFLRILK